MDEPIAIIGLDARLPGDGDTPEKFYEFLLSGRSARSPVPSSRYNAEAFWHPDNQRDGSITTKYGHFLQGSIAEFDAPFFSITPAEAASMDPQQRGILECVYRALENAGIPLSTASGTRTGVYVGCFSSDYRDLMTKDLDAPLKYAGSGTIISMLSNRVSWFYDFQGPSLTIDTACSSSLVAAHQACVGLRAGDISMAIVGGTNLLLSPEMSLELDALGVLSPDGVSYSFDHRANGYSRGEGIGVIVLKRVSDALRDGDTIRAVIRNTGSNQDGHSPGLTQPTKAAQVQLMQQTYAGLDPSLTRFCEAHGTGTPVGDPIEASAISEVFTQYRSADEPLYVGAMKSNVGHLEGAAGIAAIIKGVFTLERGVIPANAWFEKLNPRISESWNLAFPTKAFPWPQTPGGLRRMSINSFGVGGTNAHMVMDDTLHFLRERGLLGRHFTVEVPQLEKRMINGVPMASPRKPQIFVFSAHDQEGITRLCAAYGQYLASKPDSESSVDWLQDLSFTLAARRTNFSWRTAIVANSTLSLRDAFAEKPVPVRAETSPRLAFVFTGQGAQWAGMGKGLMVYSVFRASLNAADAYLRTLGWCWSLIDELSKGADISRVDDPEFSQPLCTALQVALVDLLTAWGVSAHAVAGHSSGEIAAAYAVDAISAKSAWRLSFYRGQLSAKLSRSTTHPRTAMAAVGLNFEQTSDAIDRVSRLEVFTGAPKLEIACHNSESSYTVSGDVKQIEALIDMLSSEKAFVRKLKIEIGYHSSYMKPISDEYLRLIGQLDDGSGNGVTGEMCRAQYFSSTLGTRISPSKLRDGSYWVTNLVCPVLFRQSVTEMLTTSLSTTEDSIQSLRIGDILEIGPHSGLRGPLRSIIEATRGNGAVKYYSMLHRGDIVIEHLLKTAGDLFCQGLHIDLLAVNQTTGENRSMLTDLPSYPFNHTREYWSEGRASKNFRLRNHGRHELLGAPVTGCDTPENVIWHNWIKTSEIPWVEHHQVSGLIVYPAAGMLVMAIEACRQMLGSGEVKGFKFKEVSFHSALHVPTESRGIESQFYLRSVREAALESSTPSWREFRLSTFQEDTNEWREHCRGLVQIEYNKSKTPVDGGLEDIQMQARWHDEIKRAESICTIATTPRKLYHAFKEVGLEFGTTFQTLVNIQVDSRSQKVLSSVSSTVQSIAKMMPHEYLQSHLIHPTTLDGVFQACLLPLINGLKPLRQGMVPIYVDELWVSAVPFLQDSEYIVCSEARPHGRQEAKTNATALESRTRKPMALVTGLVFKTVDDHKTSSSTGDNKANHRAFNIAWKPNPDMFSRYEAEEEFALVDEPEQKEYEAMDLCIALCIQYLRQALRSYSLFTSRVKGHLRSDSGYGGAPEDAGTPEEVPLLHGHLQQYVSLMEKFLQEYSQDSWVPLPLSALETKFKDLNTPDGNLAIAVGKALPDILGGSVDPLSVIFSGTLADDFYRNGFGARRCYAQLEKYLDALAHKNPALRILEVGAGTGGTTKGALDLLGQRYQQYDFTDISPSFFEKAKEKLDLEDHRVGFKVLDIERSPAEQGFELGSYDVVLATNCLHATKNIDNTLRNVCALLRPGGKLLLAESTDPRWIFLNFVFGLLPGWWLSEDIERLDGPLMTIENWNRHLVNSGFTGLDAVFHDYPDCKHQFTSVLVSTAPHAVAGPTLSSKDQSPTYIVVDPISDSQRHIAAGLASSVKETQDGPCEVITLAQLADGHNVSQSNCVILSELESPLLTQMTENTMKALKSIFDCRTLLWLHRSGKADMESVAGFASTMRLEKPSLKFATLSFEPNTSNDVIIDKSRQVLGAMTKPETTSENSYRCINGRIHVPRLLEATELTHHIEAQTAPSSVVDCEFGGDPNRSLHLQIETLGLLDTLRFEDDPIHEMPLGDLEVEFETKASGINFHDLAVMLGRVEETALGLEAAGIVTRIGARVTRFRVGDRVFGFAFQGSFQTHVRTREGWISKMPDDDSMSFAEAAAMPIVYTTAFACLYDIGGLQEKKQEVYGDEERCTVLIHAAAGGVGQAAIQFAQREGAEVFATVGSLEKRDFLETTYGIPRDHIFSSRDLSFKEGVLRMTKGRGVDIILNSLSGDALRATWDCIAPFGRFAEMGLTDIDSKSRISMGNFTRNARFEAIELFYMQLHDPKRMDRLFQRTIDSVINRGLRRCTPIFSYRFSEIQGAMRHMQSGKHIGKLVLEPHGDEIVPLLSKREPVSKFSSDATYVIAGGLGGVGQTMAQWMIDQGAKNLILLSRQGPKKESAMRFVEHARAQCHNVAAPGCDITDIKALELAMSDCLSYMPPAKGCIQASMVLSDNRFDDMSLEEWHNAVNVKVAGSSNLWNVISGSNKDQKLDFFIMLSSITSIIGNPEQANYSTGNAFQDALARQLSSQGEHAVSINVPVLTDVGFVAEKPELMDHLRSTGWSYMSSEEILTALDYHCHPLSVKDNISVKEAQVAPRLWLPQYTAAPGASVPAWGDDDMFSHLVRDPIEARNKSQKTDASQLAAASVLLSSAKSQEEVEKIVLDALLSKLSRVLSVDAENLDPLKPLHAYGVDSLVAVELRSWMSKEIGADVSVFEMTSKGSIGQLAVTASRRSRFVSFGS